MENIANSLAEELSKLAKAHRILEMEGHGDRTLGHMAMRDPDGRGFWLKRMSIGLGQVGGPQDFVLLDFEGQKLAGSGAVHNEWPIHAEIMRARPDVMTVGHAHPFYGCVFSASDEPLKAVALEGGYFSPGVPRYDDSYDLINTPELGRGVARALGGSFAVFLKNHGVVFCGTSTEHATVFAVALERACRAQILIGASGMKWSPPTPEGERVRSRQTVHRPMIERSWKYYCEKLAWVEAGHPHGSREIFGT